MTNRFALILFFFSISFFNHLNAQTWVPIWSDEFNYSGSPDATKWTYDVGGNGWGNSELQYYTDARAENARVENGNLIIEARKESYQGNDYTSARLISKGLGDFKYGKIEVRAKLPTGKGMWPAIWMLPTENVYGNWPKSGEIDIMENVGYDPNNIHWNVHTESYNHSIGTNKGSHQTFTEPNNNFYTYAVEWYEDSISFLVDGVEYYQFNKESNDYKVWPFKEKFHLLLNVAVGGSWGGVQGVNDSIFPQRMEVDYVRVYKQSEGLSSYTCDVRNSRYGTVTKSPDANSYAPGTAVQLTALPYNSLYVFNKWYGTIQDTASILNLPMNLNYTQIPEFLRPGEMISNSQFLGGNIGWGGYGAPMTADTGVYTTTITTTTNNVWDIQIYQEGLVLEAGANYIVNVVASASQDRDVKVALGKASSPWTSYGNSTLALTSSPQIFNFQFVMGNIDSSARVVFDLGMYAGDVSIYDVSVVKDGQIMDSKEVGSEEAEVSVYPNPVNDYLIVNGVSEFSYRIYTMEGKLVKSGNKANGGIDMEGFKSGVYGLVINGNKAIRIAVK